MCDVRRPLPLAPPVANCIKTIQPVRGVSPLKLMEIYENKYRSTEHGCIGFRWLYMWDPEYCDSELGAVEASGESRYELCPSTDTAAETQSRRLSGGTRVTSAWQWPRTPWTRHYVGLPICSTSSRPQMSCRIPLCIRVI